MSPPPPRPGAGNTREAGNGWCLESARRAKGRGCKSEALALSSFLSGFKSSNRCHKRGQNGFYPPRGAFLAIRSRKCLEMLMYTVCVAGVCIEMVGNSSEPNKTFCY